MDSRTYRLAILSIVSILLLVTLIVYAANAERITRLIEGRGSRSSGETTEEIAEASPTDGYGEQIGDDLKGFLRDDKFFDTTEKNSSVVITTVDKPPAYPIVDDVLKAPESTTQTEGPSQENASEGASAEGNSASDDSVSQEASTQGSPDASSENSEAKPE